MFAVMGLLDLLQSDNGGEFSNIAIPSKTTHFNEQEPQSIINHVHQIWPGVKQITGTLRHSPSNGRIERFNQIIEEKVNNWML